MTPATAAVASIAADRQHQAARRFTVSFAPDKARVGGMRRITSAHLRLWKIAGPTAADTLLTVSELVTNAIQHASGDNIALTVVLVDEELRVEVTDGNPEPAQMAFADDTDESGRGLFIVAVIARDWGVSDHGTTTWAILHVGRA
ncbi:ATP-binding protein [Streptomyces kronopolitis]|uniref:ATP-binding protein n=1 Tax=Streptomyces kronopolitis TaxID=1612435 RepID=UPI003D95C6F7